MTFDALRLLLAQSPLVASVQASEGGAIDDPGTLARLAQDSASQGVQILRLQGVANIAVVRAATGLPTIGLIKRAYSGFGPYITPTETEVDALLDAGCEVVALDGTRRARPSLDLGALVARIHRAGRLAMADCDGIDAALFARAAGADLVGTTLAGYTETSAPTEGPDLDLLREAVGTVPVVIAEGRYARRWQVEAALQIGASGVVVGGALNDPIKTTRALMPRGGCAGETIAAFDLGGTWLRFATEIDGEWESARTPLPPTRDARNEWMRARIVDTGATRAAVSTGGTVDPATGEVWEAKPMIPEHLGTVFDEATLGVPTIALNDGLATALAHARHPMWAGRRVASLALGTGVGAGVVIDGELLRGPRGEYPRLNDLPGPNGLTIEEELGGAALSPAPTAPQRERAIAAFRAALAVVRATTFPEVVVVGGGVGLAPWMLPVIEDEGCEISPFGHEAGLRGALSLGRWGI